MIDNETALITDLQPAKQGIGSLEIGLQILETIAASPRPVTSKQLSSILQFSPSRLHKYLVSLTRKGYITQLEGNRYALNTASLQLGIAAFRRIDPIKLTFDAVSQLHEVSDRTVSVTIWNGKSPLIIKWLDSSQPLSVNVRLGSELSPFFSAAGRLFLTSLPQKRTHEIVEDFYHAPAALPRHRGTPLDKAEFYSLLDTIKANNISCFFGDFLPDINVVSSPVFDVNGCMIAVISLMGLAGDTDVEQGSHFQELTSSCASRVTNMICGESSAAS